MPTCAKGKQYCSTGKKWQTCEQVLPGIRRMKPTAESVGISKLCRSLLTFPSGYCRFGVEIQCIPVDIDIADLFFTAFPFVFVSQPSGKQRLGYDNKTNGKAVINGPAQIDRNAPSFHSERTRAPRKCHNRTAQLRNSYGFSSRFHTPDSWTYAYRHFVQMSVCWDLSNEEAIKLT